MSSSEGTHPGAEGLRDALQEIVPPAPERERVFSSLLAYADLLREKNQVLNLVSRSDAARILERHVIDSLSLIPTLDRLGIQELLDVGAGGGLPGIPVAIARPSIRVTLVESRRQKSLFLLAAARSLELSNTRVWCERVENLAGLETGEHDLPDSPPVVPTHMDPPSTRPSFDGIVARAVADIRTLASWTAPLARPGARLLLFKGSRLQEELVDWAESPSGWELELTQREIRPQTHLVVLRYEG